MGSACPAPSWLSVPELCSHTHPAPGDSWRPRALGEAAAPAVLAFLEEPSPGQEQRLSGEGSPEQRRNAAVGPGPARAGTPEPGPVAFGT